MNMVNSIKRKAINIYKMLKYAYLEDRNIRGQMIQYGKHKKQCYKLYKSKHSHKPTIFFIHGGGWKQGSPSLYSGVGKYFSKRGYDTVIVGYRLVPRYHYPIQIEDAFCAIRHYVKQYPNKNIIVGGYSAGGEIASHLVFDLDRLKKFEIDNSVLIGFISISGVLDFSKCDSRYSLKLIKKYLDRNCIYNSNPINLLNTKSEIPTLCIHGDKDTIINVNNSISFINKLRSLGINKNIDLKVIKNLEHEHTIDMVRGPGNIYSKYIFNFIESITKRSINPQ